jgi:hypothetical protein
MESRRPSAGLPHLTPKRHVRAPSWGDEADRIDEWEQFARAGRVGRIRFIVDCVRWPALVLGISLLYALRGHRDMWFLLLNCLLLIGFFVLRWTHARLRPVYAWSILVVVEAVAITLAWL